LPILRDNTFEAHSRNPEQTLRLGQRLGQLLTTGDVVCLNGQLGAGKTTLARGIGQGWGSSTPLTSPTYTLVHIHRREQDIQQLYHVDAYRLESPAAISSVGLDDVFDGNGPVIIEWPLRIKSVLPQDCLWIHLEMDELDPDRRLLTFESRGERHLKLLMAYRQAVYGVSPNE
jgi:tRNA threonylcarbamoyladenosine biosynthesis protein TsaE